MTRGGRFRGTAALVDLDAVRANLRHLTPRGSRAMAVVKADAYGHGLVHVARAAADAGTAWLGVALVEEGVRLRDAGIAAEILVLTEFPPGSESDALRARLTPTVHTRGGLHRLARAATDSQATPSVHVKIDTGLHRIGLPPRQAVPFVTELKARGLRLGALWTHFAKADEPHDDFTQLQLSHLQRAASSLRRVGIKPPLLHAANTAAIMAWPVTHLDLVRVGIGMYGVVPPGLSAIAGLTPAMSVRSCVSMTKRVSKGAGISYGLTYRPSRDATIVTVPVGYGDGYPRAMSNRGSVLIRGRRYPIAGLVAMDQLMVDCGRDNIAVGDEVVLIGRQGTQQISASEVAALSGTIPHEVLCSVSARVPRVYLGE